MLKLFNEDCIVAMREMDENQFDLAIVDPPYGLNFGEFQRTNKDSVGNRFKAKKYKNSNWDDSIPSDEYFEQLFRVSKNQIVWGGNYFPYLWQNGCRCFIYWHKGNPVENFSDGELAFTSFNKPCVQIDFRYYGNLEGNTSAEKKIHPTQKPVGLYERVLQKFANPGDSILDTHLGSGSIAIACHNMKYNLTAYEIDADYFEKTKQRIETHQKQVTLF